MAGTLNVLRKRASSDRFYLKPKNILPVFYTFLKDSNEEIRTVALDFILGFGAQGQLMLIEGLTRDQNPFIRAECCRGLVHLGGRTFRTVVYGLLDSHHHVRKYFIPICFDFCEVCVKRTTEELVLSKIDPNELVSEFQSKPKLIPSLICTLKDVLESQGGLSSQLLAFVRALISILVKIMENEVPATFGL